MSVSGRVSFLLLVVLQWMGHPFRNEGHFGHEPRASGFNSSGPEDRHWPMSIKHVELMLAFLRNCLSPWPQKNNMFTFFFDVTRSRSARRTRRQFANEAMLSPTSVPLSVQDSTNPHWQSVKIAEWDQSFQKFYQPCYNHVYSNHIYLQVLLYLLYSHRMNHIMRFNINVIIKLHFVYPRQYKQHIQIAQIGYITFHRSVTTNPNVLTIEISTPPTISSAAIFLGIRCTSYVLLCLLVMCQLSSYSKKSK